MSTLSTQSWYPDVEDFKTQFPRFSPQYLPVYVEGTTYFLDDIVYYYELFYICVVDSTTNDPTTETDWQLTSSSVLNYTQDSDIENAFLEAGVNFNPSLFSDDDTRQLVFLYLAAHYLTVDFNNAVGSGGVGIVQSKSVGSVSESYAIPKWLTDNAGLSVYATTGYGIKYASLIRPYLIGNVFIVKGRTTGI